MREDLIGYVLGALDGPEHESVKRKLQSDEKLQHELERLEERLEPLQQFRWDHEPPRGLARLTCQLIADDHRVERPAMPPAPRMSPCPPATRESAGAYWSRVDLVATASVACLVAFLLLPAIANSRHEGRILACQNKLQLLGESLDQYCRFNDGCFPKIPATGKLAVAGAFVPTLVDSGHLSANDRHLFVCPDSELSEYPLGERLPNMKDVLQANGPELARLQKTMAGSYAYALGYTKDGKLYEVQNLGRTRYAVMADVPSAEYSNVVSSNHGGRGFNVLFEDGHVEYLSDVRVGGPFGDDVFHNDHGIREAGLHQYDAVMGTSATPPLRLQRLRSEID